MNSSDSSIADSRKTSFLFSAVLSAFFAAAAAGQTVPLTVTVKDPNGAPVPGARVSTRCKSGTEISGITGADGTTRFEPGELRECRVVVDALGFPTTTKLVDVVSETGSVEIELPVGTINESVTVTATRTQVSTEDTAVPVTVVGRTQLEQRPVNSIGDVFRSLPGTSTVNEGAFQVRPRIRGLESNRILILVDGERLNNARTSTGQSGIEIGLVDIDQIDSIELVRGAGSVLYGTDALAGTVNIITRDTPRRIEEGFRFGGLFNGYYSSNENGRRGTLAVTGSSRYFAFRVGQSLERFENYHTGNTDGLGLDATDGFVGPREVGNSQSHGGNTNVIGKIFFNENNDLKLNYERRRGTSIGSPLLTNGFGFNAYFPYSNRDKFGGRFSTRNLTSYLASVSASFYVQDQERQFTNVVQPILPFFGGSFSETTTDTRSVGFDAQSNWILGSRNFLTAGVSYFRDENVDTRLSRRVAPPIVPNRTTSVPRADFGGTAFFVQNEFTVSNRLKLIGGIRIERFRSSSTQTDGFALPATIRPFQLVDIGVADIATGTEVSETPLTGDFGVVFRLTDAISLTGRVGRSFRVANLFERFFTGAGSVGGFLVGNPALRPERGVNVDLGLKFRTSRVAGSFTYFNNNYRDFLSSTLALDARGCPVLILTPTTVLDASQCQVVSGNPTRVHQTINFGRVRLQGFEAEMEGSYRIGDLGFLTPGGSLSYLRADDRELGQPFNVAPALKTVLSLRYSDPAARFFAEGQTRIVNRHDRFSSTFLASNGGAEPGYAVTDLRGGYNFRRERYRLGLNVGLTNIFNRFYNEQFVFAPARGRSLVLGTTWEIF